MARGYDNGKVEQGCLLDLRLFDGTGAVALDWAKPHHAVALATPVTWTALATGQMTLDFNPATPDRLVCLAAACLDLGFTSGDFSGAVWIYPHAYGNRYFMHKGAAGTGWAFWVTTVSPYLCFTTEQAGPTYQTTQGGGTLALNAWQLAGFSRSGASGRTYLNGVDATSVPATHVDPAASAAGDFYMGTTVGGGAGFYDGLMGRPRVWGCTLTADEHAAIFDRERHLYDV